MTPTKRILLIDDTDALSKLMLANAPSAFEVVTARTGAEASLALDTPVDSVLVNPRRSVPGVDTFIRRLGDTRFAIPVAFAWEDRDVQAALVTA